MLCDVNRFLDVLINLVKFLDHLCLLIKIQKINKPAQYLFVQYFLSFHQFLFFLGLNQLIFVLLPNLILYYCSNCLKYFLLKLIFLSPYLFLFLYCLFYRIWVSATRLHLLFIFFLVQFIPTYYYYLNYTNNINF